MRYCTSCGKELISGKKFCEYCGTPVEQSAAELATPGVPAAPGSPPAVPVKPSGRSGITMVIAGMIGVLVIAAGIYFIGLPLISGSNGTGSNLQQSTILPSPTLTQLPMTISTKTTSTPTSDYATTAQTTVLSPPTQTYKNVDLVLALNTQPAYGFKIDYPLEWSYKKEHTRSFNAGYNFSSPDNRSYVSSLWLYRKCSG
jgi:hypothetical protein